LYELSHDSLDDIFRSFSLEFEKWVSKRIYLFWSVIFVLLFVLPFMFLADDIWGALFLMAVMIISGVMYLGLIWVIMLIAPYIAAVIYYPIVRQLARGSIKPSATTKREPTRGT
jgi:cellulose synthase/poly-beta-1,6-N-acetylglucosamine synthase-like glycosyltransferase